MAGRLTLALDAGAVVLPAEGPVAVFGPAAGCDLSAIRQDRIVIVQGFKPDHDSWAARGYRVVSEPGAETATAAVVVLPRAKDAARARVHAACRMVGPGGTILVDGAKENGVEAMIRALGPAAAPAFSKAHGKVFALDCAGVPDDWAARRTELPCGFVTLPGTFSADGIDPGSTALAEALPKSLKGRAADLGAGWGYLSAQLLKKAPGIVELDLIEADHDAIEAARINVADPRARFLWADACDAALPGGYDVIVSNPPFHNGRHANPNLGRGFIRAAAWLLAPRGEFWMVANRHLPYEATLRTAFAEVTEVPGTGAFKLFRAARPRPRP